MDQEESIFSLERTANCRRLLRIGSANCRAKPTFRLQPLNTVLGVMREILQASDNKSLKQALQSLDDTVKPRGDGRTSDQTELWIIKRTLLTILKHMPLDYPVKLVKNERPDFLLHQGNITIGIEVSEIVDSQLAKAQTLPETQEPNTIIDRSKFRLSDANRTLEQLRELASATKLDGPGWCGDSVERELAFGVGSWLENKRSKLSESSFKKCQQNWLVLYNNLQLPNIHLNIANPLIMGVVVPQLSDNSFNLLLLLSLPKLITYSESSYDTWDVENDP
ncbi:MAG: hypothetical protein ACFHXK_09925 [bacterium]